MTQERNVPKSVQTLTIAEAAEALRIHRKTLYTLFDRGDLPFVVIGTRRRVRVAELEAYLEKSAR